MPLVANQRHCLTFQSDRVHPSAEQRVADPPKQSGKLANMRGGRKDCVVYVGELPDDIREREVEDLFYDVRTSPRPVEDRDNMITLPNAAGAAGLSCANIRPPHRALPRHLCSHPVTSGMPLS